MSLILTTLNVINFFENNFVSKVLYQFKIYVNTKLVLRQIFFPRLDEISPGVQFILKKYGGMLLMKRNCILIYCQNVSH